MAKKRMMSPEVVCSDAFKTMPLAAQALYLQLNMIADDDGVVTSTLVTMLSIRAKKPSLDVLISRRFVLVFNKNDIVIKHWKKHNKIREERYTPSNYTEITSHLFIKKDGSYTDDPKQGVPYLPNMSDTCQTQGGHESDTGQTSGGLGKVNIGKDSKSLATSTDVSVSKDKNKETNPPQIKKEKPPETDPVVGVVIDSESSVPDLKPVDQFWNAYPRKEGRGDVEKWFLENNPDKDLMAKIISSIEWHRTSRKWLKDPRFISTPINWLNGKRWEDVPEADPEAAKEAYNNSLAKLLADEAAKKQKELEANPIPEIENVDPLDEAVKKIAAKKNFAPPSDPLEQLRYQLLGEGYTTTIIDDKLIVTARGYDLTLGLDKVKQKLEKQGVQFTTKAIRRKFDESIH